jgi:predicted MFS family arabinose efflux permease
MNFLDGLWFPGTVFVVFLLDNGMSLIQVGLILCAYSIIPFLLDLPSSILADKHSRKLMLVLMSLAYMLQNVFYFFGHSFSVFFLASCFNGIGTALSFGISSAFVYDTLISIGKEEHYEKVQSKVMMSFFVGRLLATTGAYIYLINQRMVFLLSVATTAIGFLAALSLKEPSRRKGICSPFSHIREGLGFLAKHRIIWYTVILFSLMAGIDLVLHDYYQPVMKAAGFSIASFGIIYFFANLFSFTGSVIYPNLASKLGWQKIMVFYLFMTLITALSFATGSQSLVILAVIGSSLSLGLQSVFIGNAINKVVPSTHRATSLSIQTQMQLVFDAVILMIVSIVAEKISIGAGMVFIAIIIAIALVAFLKLANERPALA